MQMGLKQVYSREVQDTPHSTVKSVILKACQSCHARLCSSFSLFSSASIINTWTGWNRILLAYGPSVLSLRMDITRQCILWGLLGRVVFVVVLVFNKAESNYGTKRGTSPHALSGGGLSVAKLRGSSAQQLDDKSWQASRVFTFTSLCFGLTPTEQQNSKTRLILLQISWKLASHSICTKHLIMLPVSHSPKAANDCSL